MSLPDFELTQSEFSDLLKEKGIQSFTEACDYIRSLPYGRTSDRNDLSLLILEEKGTCSSKHGFLGRLIEENGFNDIQLIAGIFLMSPETHPVLTNFFKDKPYTSLPEMHCYLRYQGQRFDFTSLTTRIETIEPKIIREQRIEPHQTGDWKIKIHQEYIKAWLLRNPQIEMNFEDIWKEREACIGLF
jgi:hypothetical protein